MLLVVLLIMAGYGFYAWLDRRNEGRACVASPGSVESLFGACSAAGTR